MSANQENKCPRKCDDGWEYDPEWREHRQCPDPFHTGRKSEPVRAFDDAVSDAMDSQLKVKKETFMIVDPTPVTDLEGILAPLMEYGNFTQDATGHYDQAVFVETKQAIDSLINQRVIEAKGDVIKEQIQFIATVFEELGIDRLTLTNRAKINASTCIEMWDDMDGTHYLLHKDKTNE